MISKTKIVARYAETDQMGIVHHSVYPIWFEVARTEYIKKLGITYSEMEELGVMLPLINLTCTYKIPAKYEDEIIIHASVKKITYTKILFYYELEKDNNIIASGSTEHGFANSKTFRPVALKRALPEVYNKLSKAIV